MSNLDIHRGGSTGALKDNEFRNRFGSRYDASGRGAGVGNGGGYLKQLGRRMNIFQTINNHKSSNNQSPAAKRKSSRDLIRVYAVYFGLFLVGVTALIFFSYYAASSSSSANGNYDYASDSHHDTSPKVVVVDSEVVSDSSKLPPNPPDNEKIGSTLVENLHANAFPHHGNHYGPPGSLAHHSAWHKKIFHLRPEDVMNRKFDHMAISILVRDEASENVLIQTALSTFLRQINRIQVCTDKVANTFIGGGHDSFIAFEPQAGSLFPTLERYIEGYKSMYKFAQMQDWFLQIDEDSYLFMENIYQYLANQKYKGSDKIFLHNFDVISTKVNVHYTSPPKSSSGIIAGPTADYGHFPVSIMSRGALEVLLTSDYHTCIQQKKYIGHEETILLACLEEMGVTIVAEPKFHTTEPAHDFAWPANACDQPLSLSQLSFDQLQILYKSQPSTGRAVDGSVYKWDTAVTYSDVFHHTYAHAKPARGIDRHSAGDSKTTSGVGSGVECMEICKSERKCLSWTFEGGVGGGECYTSSHIGISLTREGVVSGVVGSRYNCIPGRFQDDEI